MSTLAQPSAACYHEAAHAACAAVCGVDVGTVSASDYAGAGCTYSVLAPGDQDADYIRRMIAFVVAGRLGEEMFYSAEEDERLYREHSILPVADEIRLRDPSLDEIELYEKRASPNWSDKSDEQIVLELLDRLAEREPGVDLESELHLLTAAAGKILLDNAAFVRQLARILAREVVIPAGFANELYREYQAEKD